MYLCKSNHILDDIIIIRVKFDQWLIIPFICDHLVLFQNHTTIKEMKIVMLEYYVLLPIKTRSALLNEEITCCILKELDNHFEAFASDIKPSEPSTRM